MTLTESPEPRRVAARGPTVAPDRPEALLDARHLAEERGWRRTVAGSSTLWLKGHLHGSDPVRLAASLGTDGAEAAIRRIAALDGHFAIVATTLAWAVAATDRVGSTPLFYALAAAGMLVGSQARRLAERLGAPSYEPAALAELAMAGYTIGPRTIMGGLEMLGPGEALVFEAGAPPARRRYYAYSPWLAAEEDSHRLERRLVELTLGVLEKMVAGLDRRPVLIPLSAGLDSRLVASGLRHIGHRGVRCFSYGLPGNHEAEAGRRIAEALGYPWTFVAHAPARQRALFGSAICRDHEAYADTLAAVPFQQDLAAVSTLKARGYAPAESVFVNGQSGDFITGNHIPDSLFEPAPDGAAVETRWRRITDVAIAKHFSLWGALKTEGALARIRARLAADLESCGAVLGDPALDYALYECSEFQNRQSKYVVQGQRTYEFLGFDWRLPLWDRDFVDFWERAPLAAKRRQALYRATLERANWGGVWGSGWRFPLR
ncbi:MAG: asparagine synthase-related protein, partial [Alphaproteobacteria bacterium]